MDNYGIESYGISITTLEEVFLNINKEFKISIGNSEQVDVELAENLDKEIENYQIAQSQSTGMMSPKTSLNKVPNSPEMQAPRRLVGNSDLL